ncbi:MAG: BirA family biotin operon repressor/biotin-[acetyl-CoA-carboxylase] ligase [Crocinitomicaceae bacterium]|jgi:BirA family biotin operon repressor/biotin-[acetyl-CoA-carboxylase] ligase
MRIGCNLIHLESVDSTNNYVANLVKQGNLTSGTVILADEQLSGRGQRSAEWLSNAGENLTFTIYLDDVNLSVDRQFMITQLIAVGLHRFLTKMGIDSTIKWPNDTYVNNCKISGMLIENQLSHGKIHSTIIGIGLNVNQVDFGGMDATSMTTITGQPYLLMEAYFSLIHTLNETWEELIDDARQLTIEYLGGMYQLNEEKSYADVNGNFNGIICGISSTGKLQIQREDQLVEYSLKEIQFL